MLRGHLYHSVRPGWMLRSFAGNIVPGEARGYRPLHDLSGRGDGLTSEHVSEELWNMLGAADKYVTQCSLYGGMWMVPIIQEVRSMLENVETAAEKYGYTPIDEIREAILHIRRKARQLEYDFELNCTEGEEQH